MNLINIIEGIERLVISLLFWIIFIPKTLFKIVTKPSWVPGYVTNELTKDSQRFSDYMSPIVLYLLNTVLLLMAYIHIKRDVLKESLTTSVESDDLFGNLISKLELSDSLLDTLSGSFGIVAATVFLSIPLFFAIVKEIIKKKKITRAGLTRATYIQCYYFSPLALAYAGIFYSGALLEDLQLRISLILFLLFLAWFAIAQVRLLAQELNKTKRIALLIFLGVCTSVVLTSYGVVSTFVVFDEDRKKVRGQIDELVIPASQEKEDFAVLVKCPACSDEVYDYTVSVAQVETGEFIIDPEGRGQQKYLPFPSKNETRFSIEKHEDEEITLEILVKTQSNVLFYVDVLDSEGNSLLGGIRSKEAKVIRKYFGYVLFIFLAFMVVKGLIRPALKARKNAARE